MASSIGIYTLTNFEDLSQLPAIIDKLQSEYECNLLGNWRLDYRLLRSITGPQLAQSLKLQHVLHLSNDPRRVFVGVEGASEATGNGTTGTAKRFTLTSVPGPYAAQYNNLLNQKMSGIWTAKSALSLNGSRWEIGSTIIYTGELRVHGGSQPTRAVLVAFETKSDETNDSISQQVHEAVRVRISEMAKVIGIENSRVYWGYDDQRNIVQTWCRALSN